MTNSTANVSYQNNLQLMEGLIAKLVAKQYDFKTNKNADWANVGDTDFVNEKLMEALNFCGADLTELVD